MDEDRLFRFDLQGGDGSWRMRIVLLRTGKNVGRPSDEQEWALPWGSIHGRKGPARQAACQTALTELSERGFYHACFRDVPKGSILPGFTSC